ncbi:membrane protein insertase YidC [Candidatus Omnitrophota bacterium]
MQWIGSRDKYFCLIQKPAFEVTECFANYIDKGKILTSFKSQEAIIAPNSTLQLDSIIYVGPQKTELLSAVDPSFSQIVYFGKLDPIVRTMMSLLRFIHKVVPNWGICILILSICIFSVLYPFTQKSLRSMKRLQALQPEMEQLRAKYKDEPQKLNKEVMELYKTNKVNPFGGCLPLFFQMPVFFSLYQTLMRSIELKGAAFLWIKDLSEPDRLFVLQKALPFIGKDINLLPLLMAAAMAVSQKLTMARSGASGPAAEQQKMMAVIFPILFAFIFYTFPSGLALYWFSYTMLTMVSQLRMNAVKGEARG